MQHLQEKAQLKNKQFFCQVVKNPPGGTTDDDLLLVNGPDSKIHGEDDVNKQQPCMHSFQESGGCLFIGHRNKSFHSVWRNSSREVRQEQIQSQSKG